MALRPDAVPPFEVLLPLQKRTLHDLWVTAGLSTAITGYGAAFFGLVLLALMSLRA